MNIHEYHRISMKMIDFSRTSIAMSFAKSQGLEKPSRSPPRLEERLRSERARERQLQEDMERQMPS
jgi:hypothetical protein